MLILAVDTGTRVGSLALLRDNQVLAELSGSAAEPYSSGIFADLDSLLQSAGATLDQVDLFAVTAGPGSFTGLRIGLTAVKAWAEVYEKPIVAVSGLRAVAAQIPLPDAGAIVVPVIDARRGQVFGAIYECQGRVDSSPIPVLKALDDEVVMGAGEFLELVAARTPAPTLGTAAHLFASPSPEVLQLALEQSPFRNAHVAKVSSVLAGVIGQLGHQIALRGEGTDALHLEANYVRRTDAENQWKES